MIKMIQFIAYKLFTIAGVLLLVAFLFVGLLWALLTGIPKIVAYSFSLRKERMLHRPRLVGSIK